MQQSSPANEPGGPGQSAAKAAQHHQIMRPHLAGANDIVQRNRQRRGGGVPEARNDGAHPVGWDRQACSELRKDPSICLVKNELRHIAEFHAKFFHDVAYRLFEAPDRDTEERRASHP